MRSLAAHAFGAGRQDADGSGGGRTFLVERDRYPADAFDERASSQPHVALSISFSFAWNAE